MNVLLVAVNAKYVHSNLAVYCLKSYAASKGYEVELAEYTINQQPDEVLRDLYGKRADVVAFSCYIWNIEFVKALIRDYRKISPKTELWLGGPEVSYRAEAILKELPEARGVMCGEGEETFVKLTEYYCVNQRKCEESRNIKSIEMTEEKGKNRKEDGLYGIPGISFRTEDGGIHITEPALPPDFSRLPFPYGNGEMTVSEQTKLNAFDHRIIYYESSRGCPYSCAYCLSSIEKKVRFRDLELVKKELKFFMEQKVPQVKFIDRTFNANGKRTMEVLTFIKENDNGITNFHFEVAAELLTEEQISLLSGVRPGLIQLEIGVQSANKETLEAVHRTTDFEKLEQTVAKVREPGNVHIHLDLIAGLPKEDKASFKNSFNEVYGMRPHQLQLGFLKVLSGSPMENMAKGNGTLYQSLPPYEVLATSWLSYEDIMELKKVEEMTEVYYNSGQFVYSMLYLEHFFETPYEMYAELAEYYEKNVLSGIKISRGKRYEILLEFAKQRLGAAVVFEQILFFDYCLREKVKGRPEFGRHSHMEKKELKEAYELFRVNREAEGLHDVEKFAFHPVKTAECAEVTGDACVILFSYEKREPIYGQATIQQRKL